MNPTKLLVFAALLLLAAYFGFSGDPRPTPEIPAVSAASPVAQHTETPAVSPTPEPARDAGPLTLTAAEALQQPRQPDLAKVIAFNDWAARWQAAAPRSGNFDLSVRVASLTNPGASNSCRIGLMVRASTATNAPYAFTHHRGNGAHSYQARLTAGVAPYTSTGSTALTMPQFIRLVRSGDNFSAYHSTDGITWAQRGSTRTIPAMGPSPLVGIALTSAVTATAATAVLDQANFHLPTNIGPAVNAGAALSGSGPWNLDATASDDARPAGLATLWQPEGGVTFTNPASLDTAVTFEESGNFRLRLTASDGAITTFDDTTANVTAGSPLLTWRTLHFGTSEGSGDAANLADKDGDGLENLIEYALLTSPTQSNPSPFTLAAAPGQITLKLGRDPSRSDVSVFIESATTLTGAWTAVASSSNGGAFVPSAAEVMIGETGSGPMEVTATVNTLAGPPARFF